MKKIAIESRGGALINQKIANSNDADLLLSTYENVAPKNVVSSTLSGSQTLIRKSSIELLRESPIAQKNIPLATVSVRNVLSNLRCIAYKKGMKLITVEGEDIHSTRSFFALGYTTKNKFKLKEIVLTDNSTFTEFKWFITGIPVIWKDYNKDQLFNAMLSETADASHIYHIPRGKHPLATEKSKAAWKTMHKVFKNNLSTDRNLASLKLKEMAKNLKLQIEDNYFHNVIGADQEGNLCQIADKDSLENLGQRIYKEYGVKKALCVDNGGSIESAFYPKGIDGPTFYKYEYGHRFPGTAYIGIALANSNIKM